MSEGWDPGLPPEPGDGGEDVGALEQELRALFAPTRAPREFRERLKAELLGDAEPYVLMQSAAPVDLWSHRLLAPFRVIAAHPRASAAVSAAIAIAAATLFSLMNQGLLTAFAPHSTLPPPLPTHTPLPTATSRPAPTAMSHPTARPVIVAHPATATPRPTAIPVIPATATPRPTRVPHTATPRSTSVPRTATPRPSAPLLPTATKRPTHSVAPTSTPGPTLLATATPRPVPTTAPAPPTTAPAPTSLAVTPTQQLAATTTATSVPATMTPRPPTSTARPTATPRPAATKAPTRGTPPSHAIHHKGKTGGHKVTLPKLPIAFVTPLAPTATARPIATPRPSATATARPAATKAPTATSTPRPTLTSTATATPPPTATARPTATPTARPRPVINPEARMNLPFPNPTNGILSSPLNGALTGAQQPASYSSLTSTLPTVPVSLPVYRVIQEPVTITDAQAVMRQLGADRPLVPPQMQPDGSIVVTIQLDNAPYVLTVMPGYGTPWFTLAALEPHAGDLLVSLVQAHATAWLAAHHLAPRNLALLSITSGGINYGQDFGGTPLLGHIALHLGFDEYGKLRDLSYRYVMPATSFLGLTQAPDIAASNAIAEFQGLYQGPATSALTGTAVVSSFVLSYAGVHGLRDYLEPIYVLSGAVPTVGGVPGAFNLYISALQ